VNFDHAPARRFSVSFALLGVAAAAVCSGTANVLQARAARIEPTRAGLDTTLLVRLVRSPGYLLALGLVVAGFALSFLALRTLPLFVVQAGRASSLAVTALLAVVMFRARLNRVELVGVVVVMGGLVLLAAGADTQRAALVALGTRLWLVVAVLAVAAAATAATRIEPTARAGLTLGALAGLSFAILALGARALRSYAPRALLADPAAWAMGGSAILGLLLAAMALQRTSVVGATAPMVGTETVVGAALGMILCGDRPAPGSATVSVLGFVLVLAGALTLARFAAPEPAPIRPLGGPGLTPTLGDS
jgi:drug/metabolite transporter (DMT)-like permease